MEFGPIVHLAASAVNITQLPACAASCIVARCDMANLTCICQNGGYSSAMGTCMFQACGLSDALFSRNLTCTLCHEAVRDKGVEFRVVNFLLGSMALALVVMRILFKQYLSSSKKLGLDDWTILAAIMVGIPSVVIQVFFLTPKGLGRDIWTLDISTLLEFGRYFYVMEILYLILITLIKASLSLFYLNIFPGTVIRRLLWVTVAFHMTCGLAFMLKTVFQCTPVAYNWEKFHDDAATTGHCIHVNWSGWANGAIGVVADIWLLGLPLTQLKRLRLHWKKKVGAAIMFLTGAIITLVSVLRLKSLVHFGNSYNPTWDQWDVVFWSTIEVSAGFICTCLPALRLILMRMYPRAFKSDFYDTSSSVSRNVYMCDSISCIADQSGEKHLADLCPANLVPGHRPDSLKGRQDESEVWNGKVRIQSLQALAVDANDIEETAGDQTSAKRPLKEHEEKE